VLTAGSAASKPSELLSGRSVRKQIEQWCGEYDLVIVDTSPLLPVSDGRVLAGVCDSALLVIRADHADRREMGETMRILGTTPVQLLGVVLNGVKLRHSESGKKRGYYAYRDAYRGRTAAGTDEALPDDEVTVMSEDPLAGAQGSVVESGSTESTPRQED
jgi:Mrp family chromosome partitioning ATPase